MKLIPFLFLFMVLTGCSSYKQEEKIVQQKVSQETGAADKDSLGKTIHELISSSKTLSDAQKAELNAIFAANKQKAYDLSEESYKLRTVLVKELFAAKVNQKRIKIIKKDIKKIESLRLKNTLETVEKVGSIVSSNPDNQFFADHLLMMERPTPRSR